MGCTDCPECEEPVDATAQSQTEDTVFKAICGHVFHCECANYRVQHTPINKLVCPTCNVPWVSEEDKMAVGLTHDKFFDQYPEDYEFKWSELSDEDKDHVQRIKALWTLLDHRIYPMCMERNKETKRRSDAKKVLMAERDAMDPGRIERRKRNMTSRCYNMMRILSNLGGLEYGPRFSDKNDEDNLYDSDDGEHYTFVDGAWVPVANASV